MMKDDLGDGTSLTRSSQSTTGLYSVNHQKGLEPVGLERASLTNLVGVRIRRVRRRGRPRAPLLPYPMVCTSHTVASSLTLSYARFSRVYGSMPPVDRKSTRLNSSHGYISYAVFCLKKK